MARHDYKIPKKYQGLARPGMDKDLGFGLQFLAKVAEAATIYACGLSTGSTDIHHFPPFSLGPLSEPVLKARQPRRLYPCSERLSVARLKL